MDEIDDRTIHYYIAYSLSTSFTCLSSLLNGLIIILICCFRWNRTPRNIFIAIISISDIVLAISFTVLSLDWDFENHWRLGGAACMLKEYILQAASTARAFHFCIFLFERYLALHSSWPHVNSLAAILTVLFISLVSCLDCIPWTYFYEYSEKERLCNFIVHIGKGGSLDYIYYKMVIATSCVACFIPVIYCFIMSVIISMSNEDRMKHPLKKYLQLWDLAMVIWLIILFIISWTPIYILRMIYYFLDYYDDYGKLTDDHSYFVTSFTLLQISVGITYPIIYLSYDRGFRHSIRQMMCCCFKSSTWSPNMESENFYCDDSYIDNRSNDYRETTKLTSFTS